MQIKYMAENMARCYLWYLKFSFDTLFKADGFENLEMNLCFLWPQEGAHQALTIVWVVSCNTIAGNVLLTEILKQQLIQLY